MQFLVHYFFHLIFPGIISFAFYRERWVKVYIVLLATMLVDMDHLLAIPVYDPCRCSIGFHPLHTWVACLCYVALLFFKPLRVVGIGLLLHMATDGLDCWWSSFNC